MRITPPGLGAASDEPRALDARGRAGDEWYRLIVETTSEGIWVLDDQDRTTFVNESMASMLGYTVQEMLGRSVFDFLDDDGARRSRALLEQRRAGVSQRLLTQYRRAD